MCCGRPASGGPVKWIYVDENGNETVKATEVEAKAMQIRNNGQGLVKTR